MMQWSNALYNTFVGDLARLLIWVQIAATQFTILLERKYDRQVPPEQTKW